MNGKGDIATSSSSSSPPALRIIITKLYLPNKPFDRLTIYDGETIFYPVLAVLTGTELPARWIIPTQKRILVVLSTGAKNNGTGAIATTAEGMFQIDYIADGDSSVCDGIGVNDLTGLTGVFTDGTSST
eukprot:15352036-Ditylum_brightwellii.AAC.1